DRARGRAPARPRSRPHRALRHNPSTFSAHRTTVSLLRNASTAGSTRPARPSGPTAVATHTSPRSFKAIARRQGGGAARHVVGAAAALHPGDRDRMAVARRGELLAEQLDVADALELGIVGDAGLAIAEADLGADVDVHLGAAVLRAAAPSLAEAP